MNAITGKGWANRTESIDHGFRAKMLAAQDQDGYIMSDLRMIAGEPDGVEWIDEESGVRCEMGRNYRGCWCGYVVAPPGHAAHGSERQGRFYGGRDSINFNHPEGDCYDMNYEPRPYHWRIGFDCSHVGQAAPLEALTSRGVYSSAVEVRASVEALARYVARLEAERVAEKGGAK